MVRADKDVGPLRVGLRLLLSVAAAGLTVGLSAAAGGAAVGDITEFGLPAGSEPTAIVAGPDGNLWFTDEGTESIGRITPTGTVKEFPISTRLAMPQYITVGPDGNLWFTEFFGQKIGRITPAGVITEFSIPTQLPEPDGITAGP